MMASSLEPTQISDQIERLDREILSLKEKRAALRRSLPSQTIVDFVFATRDGHVQLSELFGEKSDLVIVHNMSVCCRHCTLWAGGFNGVVPELSSRAGFALVSPDPVDTAFAFASKRGWRFPGVVDEDKRFSTAVGRGPTPEFIQASPASTNPATGP